MRIQGADQFGIDNRLQSWLLTCFYMLGTKPTSSTSEVTYPTTAGCISLTIVIMDKRRAHGLSWTFFWCTSRKTCLTNSSVWAWDAPATAVRNIASQHQLGAIYMKRFDEIWKKSSFFPNHKHAKISNAFFQRPPIFTWGVEKAVETFRRNRKNCQTLNNRHVAIKLSQAENC